MRIALTILFLISSTIMAAPWASADPAPNSPEATAISNAALADITNQLGGKPIGLQVNTLHTSGPWAFLIARMQEPNGQPINYQGTPFATAAAHGAKSPTYAGLLRRDGDGPLRIVASAVGPTDVAWANWDQKYGAPTELFTDTY